MTTLNDSLVEYLRAYSAKDLRAVSAMFADDVALRDWKISVVGKNAAISETAKNFEAADAIDIEILQTHESKNTIAGELRITVDGDEVLYVVDVVTFTAEGKIRSIRAYLGRGD